PGAPPTPRRRHGCRTTSPPRGPAGAPSRTSLPLPPGSPCPPLRDTSRATGLPPHQYVIARRVERAKQLLQAGTEVALGEVPLSAGFCDQSQFSRHFKRLVGVTPGQFRTPARVAKGP